MIYVLSGGSGKLFAAIGVTYPAGSVCTCTKGSKTLKAKDTSGQWAFPVPEAGTWTVTATDGTSSKSKTVEITAEGQCVNVQLSYGLPIFEDGSLNKITGFSETDSGGGEYTSQSIDKTIVFSIKPYSGGSVQGEFTSTPAIDLTAYSQIKIDLKYDNPPTNVGSNKVELLNDSNSVLSTITVSDTTRKVIYFDISKIDVSIKLRFHVESSTRTVGNKITTWEIVAIE